MSKSDFPNLPTISSIEDFREALILMKENRKNYILKMYEVGITLNQEPASNLSKHQKFWGEKVCQDIMMLAKLVSELGMSQDELAELSESVNKEEDDFESFLPNLIPRLQKLCQVGLN